MKTKKYYSLLLNQIFFQVVLIGLLGMSAAYAQDQIILPPTGECLTHVEGGTSPSYTFTTNVTPVQGTPVWSVRGDIAIVSQTTTSVIIRSTGYGKGRVLFTYNQGSGACSGGQTISRDVYKTFAPPGQIVGPTCVRPGELVTFSVPPVISTPTQIAAEIDVDKYTWLMDGVPVQSTPWFPTGSTYTSGDGSSVTLVAPANLSGNPVLTVSIGRCNASTKLSLTLATKANLPVFSGTPAPTCLAVGNATPFTVSVVNETGVTYTWTATPGWTISGQTVVNGLNQVSVTPGAGTGEITVVAKANNASCESAVNKVVVNRQLVAPSNAITGGTGCLVVGSAVNFTLSNPPSGGVFKWTAPAGWSPSTATGTTVQFTPSASAEPGAQVRVYNELCPAGIIQTTPVVSSNQGLNFTITNLGCGLFRVTAPGFTRTGAGYQWFLNGVQIGTSSGNDNTFTFDPWTGTRNVSVRITRSSDCLDASKALDNQGYDCSLLASVNASALSDTDGVSAYPNPAKDQVTLTLPKDESVKQILLEDQYGKVRKRFNTVQESLTVDMSTYPQGLYMITIKSGKQTVTKKIKLER